MNEHFHWPNVEYSEGLPLREAVKSIFYGNSFHWECYLAWPGMQELARSQIRYAVAHEKETSSYGLAYADEDIVVLVSLPKPDHVPPQDLAAETFIKATLAKTGTCLKVPFTQWTDWLTLRERLTAEQKLFPEEKAALIECVPRIRLTTVDLHGMLSSIDMLEKKRLHEIKTWGDRDKSSPQSR